MITHFTCTKKKKSILVAESSFFVFFYKTQNFCKLNLLYKVNKTNALDSESFGPSSQMRHQDMTTLCAEVLQQDTFQQRHRTGIVPLPERAQVCLNVYRSSKPGAELIQNNFLQPEILL